MIVDTEGPIFEAWQRIYRERGHELPRERWLTIIGTATATFDPVLDLGQRLGETLNREEFDQLERLYYREATATQTILPGVQRYLHEAHRRGLKTAIASSSSRKWVDEHLQRLQLAGEFEVLACREDVTLTKPDPALYQLALQRLQVGPEQAIALEDSSNGIRAAKAAGIYCVAVPNGMTAAMDLSAADLWLESLEQVSLGELIERVNRTR